MPFGHFISALDTVGAMLGVNTSGVEQKTVLLLMHWEKHASLSFGAPHMQMTIRRWGLDLASQVPFLLHTMCAFAALHLKEVQSQEDRTPDEYDELLSHHFHQGLELYTSELSHPVQPRMMDALFAACMLFAMLAYTIPSEKSGHVAQTSSFDMPSADALAWLTSQTGFLILKETPTLQPYLPGSIWHKLLGESDSHAKAITTDQSLLTIPTEWQIVCQMHGHKSNSNNIYYDAVKYVVYTQDIDATDPDNFSYMICFPGHMSSDFKELVQNKDDVALLLLSHWLAKLCTMGYWWCRRRALIECRAICEYLRMECYSDHQMQTLLEVPRRACYVD